MTGRPELYWLPRQADWSHKLTAASEWTEFRALAGARLDALETRSLDRKLQKFVPEPPASLATRPIRLAVLASSTADHLLPAIRVAGARRDLHIRTHMPDYGQYTTALMDRGSATPFKS